LIIFAVYKASFQNSHSSLLIIIISLSVTVEIAVDQMPFLRGSGKPSAKLSSTGKNLKPIVHDTIR